MEKKSFNINIIIFLLLGVAIGLLIAFIIMFALKGSEKDYETVYVGDNGNNIVETKEDVLDYFNSVKEEKDENKLKKGFTNIIDFLFYDSRINGKTFKDLKDDAKLKIIKIALSVDQKIDSMFPDYKKTISDKYQNIKLKVVEKYVEITTNICNKNEQLCIDAKNDFNSLKDSFGLTYDYIKKYGIKGIDKLKEWYEDFRD